MSAETFPLQTVAFHEMRDNAATENALQKS